MEIGEIENGLKTVKNRLIQANLRLVINIAKKYLNRGPFFPRSYPGRQYGPYEGSREI